MSPRFLVDENISFRIARALHALSPYSVLSVVDHPKLGRGSNDVEQILEVCRDERWDLVLNDWAIRQKPHERAALLESDIGTFFTFWGKKKEPVFWKKALILVERWEAVQRYALDNNPPFSAMIHWRRRQIEPLPPPAA